MRTLTASRRQGRRASRHSRAGVHAAAPRRRWLAPVGVVAGILLAVVAWQVLQHMFSDGTPVPVSSATGASAAAGVGAVAQVSIGDTGDLHVVETLTFSSPQQRIDLAVPRRGGAGEDFAPTLGSIMLREPGPVREVGPMGVGDQGSYRLASPSTRVVLEYDASGVARRSGDSSSPERALALVTPLVVLGAGDLPSTVEVRSVKVLNVGCLHRGVLAGCGTRTDDGWTVETSGGEGAPDVFAQVNLAVP